MVPDGAIFTMADQSKVVYDLSNGAIFNDLEQPISGPNPVFTPRYALTAEYLIRRIGNCTQSLE